MNDEKSSQKQHHPQPQHQQQQQHQQPQQQHLEVVTTKPSVRVSSAPSLLAMSKSEN